MIIPITLVQATLLPNAVAVQFTCPNSSAVVIRHVTFCNTDTGAHPVTVHLVPKGGSVSIATMIMDAISVGSKVTYVSSELSGIAMNAGDTLQMFTDTGSLVAVNASGIQQT